MLVEEVPVGDHLLIILTRDENERHWAWEVIEVFGGDCRGTSKKSQPLEVARETAMKQARRVSVRALAQVP